MQTEEIAGDERHVIQDRTRDPDEKIARRRVRHGAAPAVGRAKARYTQALSCLTQAGVIASSIHARRFIATASTPATVEPTSGTLRSAWLAQVSLMIDGRVFAGPTQSATTPGSASDAAGAG